MSGRPIREPQVFARRGQRGAPWPRVAYPFQPSASVPLEEPPTAVQAVADAHDTPFSMLFDPPAGLGVVWIDHLVPFQRSASVTVVVLVEVLPTAVQALADVQDLSLIHI